jgi:acetyltransferase-like isoleucine patch superfamily enzyme
LVWRRLTRLWRRWQYQWWTWRFQQCCERIGAHLEVQGPCRIGGDGVIELGDNCVIRSHAANQVEITAGSGARIGIGNRVFLNQGVRLACTTEILIGDRCQIGDESVLLDTDYHGVGPMPAKRAPICLESDVWLATRVIVLRGVTIGRGSVIGAGSVVTHSIPAYSFAAGMPARVIKRLEEH